MRSRQPKDDKGVVQRIAGSRFTVAAAVVICGSAFASGNATAAFGSVSSSRVVPAGPQPSSTSPFSRWLSVRGHEAGPANLAGSRSKPNGPGGPGGRTIAVGGNPVAVAVDQATHTAYVGNGNDGTVSVINTATCNAVISFGCGRTPPTVTLATAALSGPVDAVVDQATDTIYVVNIGGDSVSVIDGKTCNASVTSGCANIPPTVTVGSGPDGLAVDQATDTVYVANVNDNTVSVINGATCNASVTTGCSQTPATITVGVQPGVPAVDQATDTVYVPDSNNGGAGTVSVIDGKTCNATVRTGCDQNPPAIPVGFSPLAAAVDQATDTVYVPTGPVGSATNLGLVYVLNGSTCNARVTSGCGQSAPTVTVGSNPIGVVVDPVTHSVFVLNDEDSTVSVIDGATCNAVFTSDCNQRPPDLATGYFPGYLDVDLATDTVYVSNQDENTVSVLDGGACTLTHQSGCRHAVPTTTVGTAPQGIAVNQATNTVYVGNRSDNDLSVINGALCNASQPSGCGRGWPTVGTGPTPQAVAVDQRTDTIYTANSDADNNFSGTTVSVINGAACNATVTSGCDRAPATVTVGNGPNALAVDQSTDTIYVANINDNTVSVINGGTCNATITSGCGQDPPVIKVGSRPDGVAVDQATDTVYVTNGGDNTVSVINGATCNATITSGCGQSPPTIAVGNGPFGAAVDEITNTLYVANSGGSTVSVINTATCNATVTSGCGQAPPTMATEGLPFGVALDQASDTIYVDSIVGSSTDVFNGATCNAKITSGCGQSPVSVPMGGWPSNVTVNPATSTVYVPDNVDGQVSLFGNPAQ
jgi:YVTN family beta-propeller protein